MNKKDVPLDKVVESTSRTFEQIDNEGEFQDLLYIAKIKTTIESKYWEIHALWRLGELEKALAKSEEYRVDFENSNSYILQSKYYNRVGAIYHVQGKLDKAKDLYQQSYKILKTHDSEKSNSFKISMADPLHNIGIIYRVRGELNRSIEYLDESYKIVFKFGTERDIAFSLENIGIVEFLKGSLENAIHFYERAYELYRKHNNDWDSGRILVFLIESEIQRDREKARSYLTILENISTVQKHGKNDPYITLYKDYAKAIYLKSSRRNREKIQSEVLFENIIRTNEIEKSFTLDSIPHMVELLLIEYQSYKEPEVIEEIHNYLNILQEEAEMGSNYRYLIKSQVIKAQLAQIEGKIGEGEKLINDAVQLAEENNLTTLLEEIDKIKISLEDEFEILNSLNINNASFTSKLEQSKILEYLRDVQGVVRSKLHDNIDP